MPMHDWTRVEAGIFHDFHLCWVAELMGALNKVVLPKTHYAQAEQFVEGGSAKSHPKFDQRRVPTPIKGKSRTVSVRAIEGHHLVAIIEVVSSANKNRVGRAAAFVQKIVGALRSGVHVLLIDPFPPGPSDPSGLHGAVWHAVSSEHDELPPDRPLTLSAYAAGAEIGGFVTRLAVGSPIPDMPLFLTPKKYVPVPLAATYDEAYAGMPEFWRDVIEK